jgi:electron transfer flavoprotein beta subunit
VINPFDCFALEEGVRLRERLGGKVTVISMGPPQAAEMLKEAISLGADEAVLLSDGAFAGADTWATAFTLAGAVRKLGPADLVICGRQSTDGDTAQVGPEMAEMMGVPFLAYVGAIQEVGPGQFKVKRLIDEGYEIIQSPLPAVITVTKEINRPRLPSLRGLMKAKKYAVPVWTASEMGLDILQVGLNGSHTKVVKIFVPVHEKKAQMIEGDPTRQVDSLISSLRGSRVI